MFAARQWLLHALPVIFLIFAVVSPLAPLDGVRVLALLLMLALTLLASPLQTADRSALAADLHGWLPWLSWAALSLIWSIDTSYSAYYWCNEVLAAFVCFWLGGRLGRTVLDLRLVWLALCGMLLAAAAATVAHVLWPDTVFLYYPGWLDNQPQAGAFLGAGVAAAICLLGQAQRRYWLLAILTLVGAQIVAWVAFKRAPYLSMGVQTLGMLMVALPMLQRRELPRRIPLVLGVFLLVIVLAAGALGAQRKASFAETGPQGTGWVATFKHNERRETWKFWWHSGQENPWLGVGVGRYLPNHAYVDPRTTRVDPWFVAHAHNMLIDQWLQLGVAGLLAWLWLWFWLFRQAWIARSAVNCQDLLFLRVALLPLMLGMVTSNLTDDLLYGALGAFWWLFAGVFLSKSRSHLYCAR